MVLDDVAALLVEAGLGALGTDIYLARMPDSPDASLAVREYGGMAPAYVFGGAAPTEEWPRIQLEARAGDYAAARLRIERAARALGAIRERDINSTRYHRLTPLGPPIPLGDDEAGRARIVVSFECAKSVSPLPV